MDEEKNDALFKALADIYVDSYGKTLLNEAAYLKSQNLEYVTPKVDNRIKSIAKNRGRRTNRTISILAASIVLVLLIPGIISLTNRKGRGSPDLASSSGPSSPAPSESYDIEEESPFAMVPLPPPSVSQSSGSGSNETDEIILIPLASNLPSQYRITDSRQDLGQSIYYISSTDSDDIVVTLEYDIGEDWFKSFHPIDIDGMEGYYRNKNDYKILVVIKDGILYTLTCRYEMESVYDFAKYL